MKKILKKPRNKINVIVVPHKNLQEALKENDDALLLFIHTTGEELIDLERIEINKANTLNLTFDDEEEETINSFRKEQAIEIIDWMNNNIDRADTIIASCKGGSCRSGAIGLALSIWLQDKEIAINRFLLNDIFLPNKLVFDKMCEELFGNEILQDNEIISGFEENRRLFDLKQGLK